MKKTNIARQLVSLANDLDASGNTEAADQVDAALVETSKPNPADLVAAAIDDAAASGYLAKVLDQRNPSSPNRLGSFFAKDQTAESLKSAAWRPFSHPAVNAPAEAFQADIPGTVGMVELSKLPQDMVVTASDPKGTHGTKGGGYSVEVPMDVDKLPTSTYTTALVGPGKSGPTLWTVFPGDPFGASIVGTHEESSIIANNPHKFDTTESSFKLTVGEAIEQGFKYGKVATK